MRVYLDHNATSPLRPDARAAMIAAMDAGGNPSSVHGEGRAARAAVERARGAVAALVGAKPGETAFCSGGSEANALALRGFAGRASAIIVGASEHDSVLENAADAAAINGRAAHVAPLTADGLIDQDALGGLLRAAGAEPLVSVMLANNETGVIAPVAEIASMVHAAGGLLHVDAAQAAGRMALDRAALGADLMTISAHKFGGPAGAGALIVREGLAPTRQIAGGGQELGRRAGTENVAAIAGFGAAAAGAREDFGAWAALSALRDRLERSALGAVPEAVIPGAGAPRLPNVSLIALPGVAGETQVMAMDLAGLAVSSGSACSSGKVKASHVVAAMGRADIAADAIRISFGPSSTEGDVDAFLAAWIPFATRAMSRRKAA